jgi:hypothetical protein
MKIALLVALLIVLPSANGQIAPTKQPPSMSDQIKADRAKVKVDTDAAPKARPWDRDVNGKRPWDQKYAPPPKE